MSYKPRLIEEQIKFRLASKGALLINGPKWCGKTTTGKLFMGSFINLQDPNNQEQYLNLLKIAPLELLKTKPPIMIDEWQIFPKLWDIVRSEVDNRNQFGQFILTGSSVPAKFDPNSHTGIGRITTLTMRPMSLFESFDSNGTISLLELFNDTSYNKTATSNLEIMDLAYLICRGGWPVSTNYTGKISLQQAKDYFIGLIEYDISNVDRTKRNRDLAKNLLKVYSRNISTTVSYSSLIEEINQTNTTISHVTFHDYLNSLKQLFVIEELDAWNPNFRSATRIKSSTVKHFVDPSIATSALGISPNDFMNDIKTFGLLFESMCIRDLRIYAESIGGKVYHYRDKTNLEIDSIIHLEDGRWGAIEIKLGSSEFIKTKDNFKKLLNKLDLDKMKMPSFMMILTGTKYAYKDEDGIWIVPIGCLKP